MHASILFLVNMLFLTATIMFLGGRY